MKRLLLSAGLLIPLLALSSPRAYGDATIEIGIGAAPVAVYDYWYYPAWGIYYDYNAHVYFYQDGGAWHRVVHLPQRFHGLGRHVMVQSERGRPWSRYEAHRAKYPPGQWRKGDRDLGHGDRDDRHFDGH